MPASTQTIVEGCSGPAGAGNGSTSAATAPKCPERYTRTQAVLHSMFTEKVGGHFLDSGDTYGRFGDAYRAAPDLLDRPEIAACGDDGPLDGREEDKAVPAERSTFHALDANLEYSAELDAEFERFCAEHDGADGLNWVDLAERFASSRDAAFSREGGVHNTYEFENLLDAPCQWFEFDALVRRDGSGGSSVADGPRQCRAVLVQIHLGCDIRGGYGRPRAFVMRRGKWLRHAARAFDAACECTQIECWGGRRRVQRGCRVRVRGMRARRRRDGVRPGAGRVHLRRVPRVLEAVGQARRLAAVRRVRRGGGRVLTRPAAPAAPDAPADAAAAAAAGATTTMRAAGSAANSKR